jgi:hypothetical protein
MGVKTRAVTVHIDELVLEGVVADSDRIRAAVERELGQLVGDEYGRLIETAANDAVDATALQVGNAIRKVLAK